ncbi:MAG: hypothetical protein EBU26_18815, partial [Verrucomicrobia bacterium]|nr:hypothetical protein [Verrucomicrobiota bacterium]
KTAKAKEEAQTDVQQGFLDKRIQSEPGIERLILHALGLSARGIQGGVGTRRLLVLFTIS